MANLTLIGLYNYDQTLFDGLTFPENIDKTDAVNEILMKSGEFEILYADPEFMKLAISHWGRKHQRTFEKWITALNIEYDPLYNYDRTEEFTDTEKISGTDSRSENNTGNYSDRTTGSNNNNVTDSGSESISSSATESGFTSGDTENKVSAYDSSSYQPKDMQEQSSNSSRNGSTSEERERNLTTYSTGSDTRTSSGNNTEVNSESGSHGEDRTLKHTARFFGNIGVTTSQQMLQSELEIARFNIYEQIADLFVDEFCIQVYA